MPFQVSPGVNVSEIDLTTVTPAVSSTEGAIAGMFRWGPVDFPVLVDSESTLVRRFGKPNSNNFETFFTAANFLAYGNKLYITRAANTTNSSSNSAYNAIANTAAVTTRTMFNITNRDYFESKTASEFSAAGANTHFVAKWPGVMGNSLKISVCASNAAYTSTFDLSKQTANQAAGATGTFVSANSGVMAAVGYSNVLIMVNMTNLTDSATQASSLRGVFTVGDSIKVGNSTIGYQTMRINAIANTTNGIVTIGTANVGATNCSSFFLSTDSVFNLQTDLTIGTANTFTRYWEYYNTFDRGPGVSTYQKANGNTSVVDEMHIVVIDRLGDFTGTAGTILEVFTAVSRATDAKTTEGEFNFYKDVLNNQSEYVWAVTDYNTANTTTLISNTSANLTSSPAVSPVVMNFGDGSDGLSEANVAMNDLMRAYDKFASAESLDISLVLAGKARGGTNGEQLANYLIDNVAENRKDSVLFISPDKDDVVRQTPGSELDKVVTFRNSLRSTSYAVLDSGYKYQYDRYNDVYRYVPLNGDTAGLCVRTDDTRDPWFSPAGFNRGQIKNIVKLAYNPGKADRDQLYKNGINPVVTFPGQGTILYGDKTLLALSSAFDRINVRRLFIILEKAISRAAKSLLFEFNDEFTRAQFKNIVEPFLRDVQGRRGITAFKVVCDETNNTQQIIDTNQFVGDIYIKPARSINFIQLNFVAVRTGVEFSEIVGQF